MSVIKDILTGVTLVKMENGFNEIFLSDCKKSGIILRNIYLDKKWIKVEIKYSDTENLIKCAEKNCMTILEIHSFGLPYLFFRYRRRFGIPIGLLLSSILIFILTSMLWSVEFNGNIKLTDETLSKVLKENGISTGVFSDTVNCDDIEFMLSNKFEQISWLSVYVVGSRLFVDIKERETEYEITDNSEYCNIIAEKNGEIIRADIFEGEGELLPGTPVVKGDLLVSGVKTFKDGRVSFVNAKADIWALTENHITISSALNISADAVTDYKNKYSISFFGLKLPWYNNSETAAVSKYFFDAVSVIFPVGTERKFCVEFERKTIELDAAKASLIAFSDYAEKVLLLEEEAEILKKNEKIIFGEHISIECVLNCKENIAQKKNFTVDNTD